jgi:hypothetical protein
LPASEDVFSAGGIGSTTSTTTTFNGEAFVPEFIEEDGAHASCPINRMKSTAILK